LETHCDEPGPIGTGRLPALGDCLATIFSTIGVDLPIPQNPPSPRRDGGRLGDASPLRDGIQIAVTLALVDRSPLAHGRGLKDCATEAADALTEFGEHTRRWKARGENVIVPRENFGFQDRP